MKHNKLHQIILLSLIVSLMLPIVPVISAPNQYRTENEILQDFFNLQSSYSDVLKYEIIGETIEGKEIYLFKLGNPLGVPVLIDAAIHGHEYITTEALYYCIEWILTEQTEIIESNYILFNPIVNRDSYRIRRTNARGVDLNRNFPTYWQATGEGTIYYSGPEPLSEPETQAIHNTLVNYQPRWYINLHSGYSQTRITPPSTLQIYDDIYTNIQETSITIFGVSPFPYDTHQFYEGMARYEGETQGAYTWEIEISSTTPSTNEFYGRVVPRLKAVFIETFLEGISEPDPTPNNPPVANANGPYVGLEDNEITFSAAGSFDPDNDPLTYIWNFGDETTIETTSETVTHTYTYGIAEQVTTYTVNLMVNDGQINSQTAQTTASITGVNDNPIAKTNGPYTGIINEEIRLNALESYDEEGISSYTWNFGDEKIISGAEVAHQYPESGTYLITLTVTDTNGATDSTSTVAEITEPALQPTVYVTITMSREDNTRGKGVTVSRAQATISVTMEGSPMKAATVIGSWGGPIDLTETKTTNGNGEVTFRTDFINNAGIFTFAVNNIQKDGINYTLQGEITDKA